MLLDMSLITPISESAAEIRAKRRRQERDKPQKVLPRRHSDEPLNQVSPPAVADMKLAPSSPQAVGWPAAPMLYGTGLPGVSARFDIFEYAPPPPPYPPCAYCPPPPPFQ